MKRYGKGQRRGLCLAKEGHRDRGQDIVQGAHPRTRPLSCQNVLATCYHVLGIDPDQSLTDFAGRPVPLLDDREPLSEMVS